MITVKTHVSSVVTTKISSFQKLKDTMTGNSLMSLHKILLQLIKHWEILEEMTISIQKWTFKREICMVTIELKVAKAKA